MFSGNPTSNGRAKAYESPQCGNSALILMLVLGDEVQLGAPVIECAHWTHDGFHEPSPVFERAHPCPETYFHLRDAFLRAKVVIAYSRFCPGKNLGSYRGFERNSLCSIHCEFWLEVYMEPSESVIRNFSTRPSNSEWNRLMVNERGVFNGKACAQFHCDDSVHICEKAV